MRRPASSRCQHGRRGLRLDKAGASQSASRALSIDGSGRWHLPGFAVFGIYELTLTFQSLRRGSGAWLTGFFQTGLRQRRSQQSQKISHDNATGLPPSHRHEAEFRWLELQAICEPIPSRAGTDSRLVLARYHHDVLPFSGNLSFNSSSFATTSSWPCI